MKELLKYLIPFTLGVFVYALITNYDNTLVFISNIAGGLVYILSRFFWGFGIAYILNFFVKWLKRRFKFPLWLAICTSYLTLLGVIVLVVIYIMPYMARSIDTLVSAAPKFVSATDDFITRSFTILDNEGLSVVKSFVENMADQFVKWATGLVDMSTIWPVVRMAGRSIVSICFAFLISVYALVGQKKITATLKRMMYAFMKPEKVDGRIQFCTEANTIFSGYIVGKFLDSLIVGVLSVILYAIFGLPMTPFLAFIAFLFNMIPYFGPVIGMVISCAILLCFSPLQALYCLIISIALQTLDGSFIGPRVLGNAVGLSPLLTIVAISIGGDLAGLLGIFLSVPIFATFKTLVVDRMVARRLEKRAIDPEKYAT